MDDKTRHILTSAQRRKTLAAVHIDMEDLYIFNNENTFKAVGKFADRLRVSGIPNIWVTFPFISYANFHAPRDDSYKNIDASITTVREFNKQAHAPNHNHLSAIPSMVGAKADETVIVKSWGSAFHEKMDSLLDIFLRKHNIDTVITTGVDYDACVARTLNDGTALDRYDFIAVEDCINLGCAENYKDYLQKNGDKGVFNTRRPIQDESAFQRRFHAASSASILKALETQPPQITVPVSKTETQFAIAVSSAQILPVKSSGIFDMPQMQTPNQDAPAFKREIAPH